VRSALHQQPTYINPGPQVDEDTGEALALGPG